MAQAREYIVIGQTPNDFINEHGTLEFDFTKLQMEFKKNLHGLRQSSSGWWEVQSCLSVKHANLLAIDTLNRLNKISLNMNNPVPLLTPLAGAFFSKDDIGKVANALGLGTEQAINMINASCQSGGQPTLQ